MSTFSQVRSHFLSLAFWMQKSHLTKSTQYQWSPQKLAVHVSSAYVCGLAACQRSSGLYVGGQAEKSEANRHEVSAGGGGGRAGSERKVRHYMQEKAAVADVRGANWNPIDVVSKSHELLEGQVQMINRVLVVAK